MQEEYHTFVKSVFYFCVFVVINIVYWCLLLGHLIHQYVNRTKVSSKVMFKWNISYWSYSYNELMMLNTPIIH